MLVEDARDLEQPPVGNDVVLVRPLPPAVGKDDHAEHEQDEPNSRPERLLERVVGKNVLGKQDEADQEDADDQQANGAAASDDQRQPMLPRAVDDILALGQKAIGVTTHAPPPRSSRSGVRPGVDLLYPLPG